MARRMAQDVHKETHRSRVKDLELQRGGKCLIQCPIRPNGELKFHAPDVSRSFIAEYQSLNRSNLQLTYLQHFCKIPYMSPPGIIPHNTPLLQFLSTKGLSYLRWISVVTTAIRFESTPTGRVSIGNPNTHLELVPMIPLPFGG